MGLDLWFIYDLKQKSEVNSLNRQYLRELRSRIASTERYSVLLRRE